MWHKPLTYIKMFSKHKCSVILLHVYLQTRPGRTRLLAAAPLWPCTEKTKKLDDSVALCCRSFKLKEKQLCHSLSLVCTLIDCGCCFCNFSFKGINKTCTVCWIWMDAICSRSTEHMAEEWQAIKRVVLHGINCFKCITWRPTTKTGSTLKSH